jgi:FixJ family two-component response regulator
MTNTQPAAARARHVVIIADDDDAVRNSLKFSFELEGFSVRTYGSGAELLESIALENGSCFVIDQKMPGMTGLDVVNRLRARQINAPAILITSHPGRILRQLAQAANVAIVEKPLLTNMLIDQVRDACTNNPHVPE